MLNIDTERGRAGQGRAGQGGPEVSIQGSQGACCGRGLLDGCPYISPQIYQELDACMKDQACQHW